MSKNKSNKNKSSNLSRRLVRCRIYLQIVQGRNNSNSSNNSNNNHNNNNNNNNHNHNNNNNSNNHHHHPSLHHLTHNSFRMHSRLNKGQRHFLIFNLYRNSLLVNVIFYNSLDNRLDNNFLDIKIICNLNHIRDSFNLLGHLPLE